MRAGCTCQLDQPFNSMWRLRTSLRPSQKHTITGRNICSGSAARVRRAASSLPGTWLSPSTFPFVTVGRENMHKEYYTQRMEYIMSSEMLNNFDGMKSVYREAEIPTTRGDEEIARSLEYGLQAAPSIKDRTISLFSRGELPHFAGINTFLKAPYLEDVRKVGEYDVAVLGAPFDGGTTYRSGT